MYELLYKLTTLASLRKLEQKTIVNCPDHWFLWEKFYSNYLGMYKGMYVQNKFPILVLSFSTLENDFFTKYWRKLFGFYIGIKIWRGNSPPPWFLRPWYWARTCRLELEDCHWRLELNPGFFSCLSSYCSQSHWSSLNFLASFADTAYGRRPGCRAALCWPVDRHGIFLYNGDKIFLKFHQNLRFHLGFLSYQQTKKMPFWPIRQHFFVLQAMPQKRSHGISISYRLGYSLIKLT
mgnify:CR=1 FL=1